MIINHNINAVNAYNELNAAGKLKSNAMEKISSGMRINKAADDSAGSAIDQKMKAQIRGLEQAGRNIQDGISLIQTAEAGLGSIQDPNLIRMRELIVQALNGTLNQDDRMKIQNELENVKASINDIANNTEFNTIKVLSPPISDNSVPPKWTAGTADIVFVIDRTGSMGSKIDDVKNNIDGFINKISDDGIDVNMGLISYGDINPSQGADSILKSNITSDLTTFKSYINDISLTGGGDSNESGLEGIADATNGALSYDLRAESTKQFILVTDAFVHDNNADGSGDGMSSFDIINVAEDLKNKGIKLTVVSNDYAISQLRTLSDVTGGDYISIDSNFQDKLDTFANKISTDAGSEQQITVEEMPTLKFQVGANSGQEFEVQLFDARTNNLGIDNVTVDPIEEAEKSLEKVDKSIEIVSEQRGKFGAYQNALEHISNNVGNYNYNLTTADSRISDADMGKEMMEVVKNGIIQESAQNILKQSDQMQQSVLDLITKWQGDR
ncbi:flagellin [Clostridium arbusti]|uniref:flagellin n=1 Tax=Clostridium arbusti TaxID=1137848 RepID=UPI000289E8C5|nr:flagellin [Clostridium arbusti]